MIPCDSQEEIDHLWEKLSADSKAEQCGWCKDKFGLSWQITSSRMGEFLSGASEHHEQVMKTFMKMKKVDIATLEKAFKGE